MTNIDTCRPTSSTPVTYPSLSPGSQYITCVLQHVKKWHEVEQVIRQLTECEYVRARFGAFGASPRRCVDALLLIEKKIQGETKGLVVVCECQNVNKHG